MDILFKNSYVRNRELAKEVYGSVLFSPIMVAVDVILAICLVALIILEFLGNDNLPLILIILVATFLKYAMYFSLVKMFTRRDAEIYGGVLEVDTEITADGLKTLASNGDSVSVSFDKIKYAKQTKKYIFLTTHTGVTLPIKKDAFTLGTKEEFVAFIRERGIRLK